MATLRDIAERTGVSLTTVSRVLNHDDTMLVSGDTRRAIFDAAHRLGYLPPRQRRQRAAGGELVIGVADWHIVVGGNPNNSLATFHYHAQRESPGSAIRFQRLPREEMPPVDGIIAFGDFSPSEVEGLRTASERIVFVNSGDTDFSHDRVLVDLNSAMSQAIDYLMGEKGQREIGYIGGRFESDGVVIGARRMNRIVSLLMEQNIYKPALVRVGNFTPEDGYGITRELMAQGILPGALIVGSDIIAAGVLRALGEAGKAVPGDVELLIYRDMFTADLPAGGYAVIEAYPELLWQKAVQMVLEQIGGRTDSVRTILSPRLRLYGAG